MSNDQKPPAKTMMGWAPNNAPGQPQQPSPWGQQPPQPAQPWGQQPPAPQPPQQAQPWQQPQPPQQAQQPQPWQPAQPAQPPQPWGQQPPQPAQAQPWGAQPPAPQQPPWGGPPAGGPPPGAPWGGPPAGGPPPGAPWGAQPGPGGPPPGAPWGAQPGPGGPPPGQQPMQPAWGGPPPQPSFGAPPGLGFGAPRAEARRGIPGADATVGTSTRLRFIRLTYLHLFGAILLFVGLEYFFFKTAAGQKLVLPILEFTFQPGRWRWGVVLAAFAVVSFIAHYLAENTTSRPLHYVGLVLYTLAEALIFVPLLAIVVWVTKDQIAAGKGDPNILRDAAYITLGVFGALTASVFVTKKDFSFLRTALIIAGAAASGLVILSLIFGFNLGIIFAIAMVVLCAGQILYKTSQIMAHDDPESYVGAAMQLFASIALMFWYVLQILLKLRASND
jgi:FtsH-binding integral membrane protein